MKKKLIKNIFNYVKLQLVPNMYIFLQFNNFYLCFIQNFCTIIVQFIAILKIIIIRIVHNNIDSRNK